MNIQRSSIAFGSNNPRILLTGATGYIGSNLSMKLASKGYDLIVCGRDSQKMHFLKESLENINRKNTNNNRFDFVRLELTDGEQVDKFLSENRNIEGVVHLAGLNSNARSITCSQDTYKTNLCGSVNLVKSMLDKGINRIVFISSGSTYGQVQNIAKIDEGIIQHPETPYAKSKAMVEKYIQEYGDLGLKSTILRMFNVAGATSQDDLTIGTNVISIIMNRLKNGSEFILNGNKHNTADGTAIRDFLHINDACEAIMSSLEKLLNSKKNSLYNVGSGKGVSLGEIINLSEKISGRKLNIRTNNAPQYEPPVLIVNNSKIRNELNWEPTCSIKDIITGAWAWCVKH